MGAYPQTSPFQSETHCFVSKRSVLLTVNEITQIVGARDLI